MLLKLIILFFAEYNIFINTCIFIYHESLNFKQKSSRFHNGINSNLLWTTKVEPCTVDHKGRPVCCSPQRSINIL